MSSIVYYGSPRQARLDANETLPAKLDLIIDRLHLRERVKGESVLIKIHSGGNIGYSTIHPVFLRKVVKAVKDGGGKPFVGDINVDVSDAESRGYTQETLGCPIFPLAGPSDSYYYPVEHPFKSMKVWKIAGMAKDASFLVNFAHLKGHPFTAYGGCIKNLALGCVTGETRSAMHDTCNFDPYWFPEKCPDAETREKVKAACPFGALVDDRNQPGNLHLHVNNCNACGRCLQVAPAGSLKIDPINVDSFLEATVISTFLTMATFAPGKAVHLSLATQITPVCDCFGFTSMAILPDAGIFGSDDLVAIEQAQLDMTGKTRLIEENIPTSLEVHTREGHPFRWLHGPFKDPYKTVAYAEKYGLGSRDYKLVDVLPVEKITPAPMGYIPAK